MDQAAKQRAALARLIPLYWREKWVGWQQWTMASRWHLIEVT
jgi:hypothetical protein